MELKLCISTVILFVGNCKIKEWGSKLRLFVGDYEVVHASESLSLSVSEAWTELGSPHT